MKKEDGITLPKWAGPTLFVMVIMAMGVIVKATSATEAQTIVDKQQVITDERFNEIEESNRVQGSHNNKQDLQINTLARDMIAIKEALARIERAVTRE